jgi:polyferredoxin
VKASFVSRLRCGVQVVFFLLFLIFFFSTFDTDQNAVVQTPFILLDPLLQICASIAGRVLLSGLAFSLISIVLTLVFGRVWCGWICPLGTIIEWVSPKAKRKKGFMNENWLRKSKHLLWLTLFGAALFGNLTFIFLDPITILNRTAGAAVLPGLKYLVYQVEDALYQIPALWDILDFVHSRFIAGLFQYDSFIFQGAGWAFVTFLVLVGLNWFAERFWCRTLCPLGGFLAWISKFSLMRRKVNAKCVSCRACEVACPMGTIDAEDSFASDPSECIVCYACIQKCPHDANTFDWTIKKWMPAKWREYDPGRREFLIGIGASVGLVAAAGIHPVSQRPPVHLVRPPVNERDLFEQLCLRCGECTRVCPTQGLQPCLLEAGWQNLMTPRLIPRLGACTYSCNRCGQVCPSGAIPALSLEEKRLVVLGLASVNHNRCLPWAYQTACIVCEESCPLPEKAIQLEEMAILDESGKETILRRPYVVESRCIGCGICEGLCPVAGDAAIQVFTAENGNNHFYI